MKISVSLPNPGDDPTAADPVGMVALARATEEAGLDAIAATDHPFPLTVAGRAGHQALDPFVLFGHLAAHTRRVALHFNLIVAGYRNPFLTARMVATLEHLAPGRVIAALGVGYMRAEFDALGAPFDRRGARLEDDVDAMRAAWTGKPVTRAGDRYTARGNTLWPVPRPGRPPMWRGGNAARAINSAVAGFDGWTPFEASSATSQQTTTDVMSLDVLPQKMGLVRDACERVGRDAAAFDVCLVRPSPGWMKDEARAVEDLRRLHALGVTWVTTQVLGRSTAERLDGIETLARVAAAADVREPPPAPGA